MKLQLLLFKHISYCKNLKLNSIFKFDKYGNVKVYNSEYGKRNCNKEQSYWIDSIGIAFWEYDIGWSNELEKLTKDSLIIHTNWPEYMFLDKQRFLAYLETNDFDAAKGNIISLIKISE